MFSTLTFRPRIAYSHVRFFLLQLPALAAGLTAGAAPAEPPAVPQYGPPSAWVVPATWTAPEQARENPGGEDFLLLDEQTHLATEENYHHRVYQIVTDHGRQDSGQVYFYFDPSYQKLTIHHLKLVRGRDVSDRLDPEKIQVIQQERDLDSQLYNGERSALLILDDIRVGDIIDLAYTVRGTNPVFAGKFIDTVSLGWGVPVRDLRYRLLVPPTRAVSSRVQGSAQAQSASRIVDGNQELTWQRADIPVVEHEKNVPSSHVLYPFLDLTEFSSWHDVVQWALPLYALDQAPHPLLDATVADLRQQAKEPEALAVAALAFVQQQIRYLGIEMGPGSHRPSEPEEVLRRRFGDCKDKARLLTALLQRLGLEAAPALVHSSRREAVRDRLPTPYAFDHVITALDFAGRRYLLDPTLSYQRGDRLALRHIGRYGPYLRIAAPGQDLETAELGTFDQSRTLVKEHFKVTALEQPAAFTVVTEAEGRAADNLRVHFATNTLDQIGREYLDYYTHYYPGITQVKPIETADNPRENRYTITEHYQVKQLFAPDPDGKILRAEFQPATIWEYVRMPNLAQRAQPYAVSHPTQLEEQITVDLPSEWKITPNDEKVTDAAFELTAVAKNPTPQSVYMAYRWTSKAYRVEPARLAEYSANAEKARKTIGYHLTWNKAVAENKPAAKPSPAAAATDEFPLNWPMIVLAAGVTLIASAGAWLLIRRKNPVPPEPPLLAAIPADPYSRAAKAEKLEGLGGWLLLVAIGLILRPGYVLTAIVGARRAYFNATVWDLLTTPDSASYNANFVWVAPLELMYNFTLLVFCGLLLFLFFRRSHLFPRTMQVFLGSVVGGAIFVLWINAALNPAKAADADVTAYSGLTQTISAALVWIPYFQVSRRVKATFTR